jgi:Protein of unknown function (DUF3662)/FHA domain
MGLADIEKRLERAVEGGFARAFKSQVRPIELARRLKREMDLSIDVGVKGQRLAPNRFEIALSAEDVSRLASLAEPLARELAEEAEAHAVAEGYTLVGPTEVELMEDSGLRTGQVDIDSHFTPGTRAPRPVAWLVDDEGGRFPVAVGSPIVIGRLAECTITVNDTNVSRRHAEIRIEQQNVKVFDLQSLNGTKVNGRGVPPTTGTVLHEGDTVSVGTATLTVSSERV